MKEIANVVSSHHTWLSDLHAIRKNGKFDFLSLNECARLLLSKAPHGDSNITEMNATSASLLPLFFLKQDGCFDFYFTQSARCLDPLFDNFMPASMPKIMDEDDLRRRVSSRLCNTIEL